MHGPMQPFKRLNFEAFLIKMKSPGFAKTASYHSILRMTYYLMRDLNKYRAKPKFEAFLSKTNNPGCTNSSTRLLDVLRFSSRSQLYGSATIL